MRIAFLRPVANRVASKTPSAPPVNRARKTAASSTVTGPRSVPAVPDRPACSVGERALLDERLELAGHLGDLLAGDELGEVDDVGADVAERAGAGLAPCRSRHDSGASGSAIQSWRYCARTCRTSPIRPSATSWRASAIAGHPAVGEADHRAHAARRRACSAAAAIASASATVLASGFSHSTCLPASSAAIAISAWVSPGVQMSTRSMSSRSTSAAPVGLGLGPAEPVAAAAAVALGVAAADDRHASGRSGRSKKRGAVRQAWEWAAPMKA